MSDVQAANPSASLFDDPAVLDALLPAEPKPLLTLELETLTPLFLGGAGRQADARDASLRGAVRWWLRALLGGVLWNLLEYDRLKRTATIESELLGAMDFASPFRLHLTIHGEPVKAGDMTKQDVSAYNRYAYVGFPMVDSVPRSVVDSETGQEVETKVKVWTRDHWQAGTRLTVRVDAVGVSPDDPRALALAGVLWTWATLGTLGARGRRGFGAMHVRAAKGSLAHAFAREHLSDSQEDAGEPTPIREVVDMQEPAQEWKPPTEAGKWRAFLERGLNGAAKALAECAKCAKVEPVKLAWQATGTKASFGSLDSGSLVPAWSSFAPGHWRLLLVGPRVGTGTNGPTKTIQPLTNWEDALWAISHRLRRFREDSNGEKLRVQPKYGTGKKTLDYSGNWTSPTADPGFPIRDFLHQAKGGAKPDRTEVDLLNDEFGLPWNWFSKTGGRATVKPTKDGYGRRASPLLARPVKVGSFNGSPYFAILYVALRAWFLPEGVEIRIARENETSKSRTIAPPPPDLPQLRALMNDVVSDFNVYGEVIADLSSPHP